MATTTQADIVVASGARYSPIRRCGRSEPRGVEARRGSSGSQKARPAAVPAALGPRPGYGLCGDTREEVIFIAHGPTGGGKTTLAEALRAALGEYVYAEPKAGQ